VVVVLSLKSPTQTDKFNIWMLLIINSLLSGVVFYVVTDYLLGRIARYGVFSSDASDHFKARSNTGRLLSIVVIAFIAVICSIMLTIAHNITLREIRQSFSIPMMLQNAVVRQNMESAFEDLRSDMELIAAEGDLIRAAEPENGEGIEKILNGLKGRNNGYTALFAAGASPEGKIFADSGGVKLRGISVSECPGAETFRSVLSGQIRMAALNTSGKKAPQGIIIAAPVKENGRVKAVVGAVINPEWVANRFFKNTTFGNTGRVIAIDGNGAFVDNTAAGLRSEVLSRLEWRSKGSDLSDGEIRRCLYDNRWCTLVPLSSGKTGWKAAALVSDSEIDSRAFKSSLFVIIFLCLGFPLIGLFVYSVIQNKLGGLNDLKNIFGMIAEGDLSQKVVVSAYNEVGEILGSLKTLVDKLGEIMKSIKEAIGDLAASSEELSGTTSTFSGNAQTQASNVEEISATVEELSAGVDNISTSAKYQYERMNDLSDKMKKLSGIINEIGKKTAKALENSSGIAERAARGDDALKRMQVSMNNIFKSSKEMTGILGMINSISDQINLLSLNAAIEAARAGDAGRGFAVVADEISKLADETSKSLKDIDAIIRENNTEIEAGKTSISETIGIITQIISGVDAINGIMNEIAGSMTDQLKTNDDVNLEADTVKTRAFEIMNAANEQKGAFVEIAKSISNINDLAQSNASGSEELSSGADNLSQMADRLRVTIEYFKT